MRTARLALPAGLLAVCGGLLGLLLLAALVKPPPAAAGTTLNTAGIPGAYVPLILAAAGTCPQVSAPLLAAQLDAESGFRPDARSPVGAQGIAQFMPGTWQQYGHDENGDGHADPFDPVDAIAAQARLMCELVDQVHTAAISGDVIDLALAAYNAGFGAVQTYNGIPPYPETNNYVARIRQLQVQYTAAIPAAAGPNPGGSWPAESCSVVPDPTTSRGCLTPRTASLVTQLRAAGFDSISCWDEHSWSPKSDHPKGKACDISFGRSGHLPTASQKAEGDQLTAQLQQLAPSLGINYLIWYGRIWDIDNSAAGWTKYDGGNVYDPKDLTGGHFDHVHVSVY